MADNPPQNREQRRAAKYGRHRTDIHDAHDPWPTSEPNPALDEAVAARPDEGETHESDSATGGDAQPDDETSAKAPAKESTSKG